MENTELVKDFKFKVSGDSLSKVIQVAPTEEFDTSDKFAALLNDILARINFKSKDILTRKSNMIFLLAAIQTKTVEALATLDLMLKRQVNKPLEEIETFLAEHPEQKVFSFEEIK